MIPTNKIVIVAGVAAILSLSVFFLVFGGAQSKHQDTTSSISCAETGLHGQLIVRVVYDNSSKPVVGAQVNASILEYCQTSVYPLNAVTTNETGYAAIPSDWAGNYSISADVSGTNYSIPAKVGAAIMLTTLHVPSGNVTVTRLKCLGPFGAC